MCECSGCRRLAQTARPSNPSSEFLVVRHPFHPLTGQRLRILFERRLASGRVYVCDSGPQGTVTVPEAYTDLYAAEPWAAQPLTYEVVVELGRLLAALQRKSS